MADRYWRGLSTDLWDGTAGSKWADTAGGATGAAVPTAADDVFFDATSANCTISGSRVAKSINCTGYTGTLAGASTPALTISGSLTLVAGMTLTYAGTTTFNATGTLTSAGKTLGPVTINGSGITVTLGDALTSSGSITVTSGTFDTGNYNVTATALSSSTTNTRTINLGSSTVTLGSSGLNFSTSTNLVLNAGTSSIVMNSSGSLFHGGSRTFNNVSFAGTGSAAQTIQGANTFNNLSFVAQAAAGVNIISFDAPQTINGTLSTTGTAGNRRVWFRGIAYGLAQTLTVNSAPSLTDADFRDIYVVGTAAPISGTRIGDLRGCRGITFDTPKTVYWNLAGAQNWSANGWATTSTGTPSTDNFPLAQDTATFTDAGSVTGTITMNSAIPYTGTVDMSGRTSAMTLAIGTGFTIYGDWKNGSGTTLSTANTLTFSGRNTQTITSAGKTFSGGITVDSYGGSVELADALNIGINSFTVTNGTFDTKNFNVTGFDLSSNNSNVRAITLGSSTVTLSGTSAVVFTTATNLTFNAGTSQITLTTTSTATFAGGGLTFYNVSFTATTAVNRSINGSNTFNNLTLTAPASAGLMGCIFNADQTITGTLTVAGDSPVRRIFVRSDTLGTTRTLTVGTLSATDCDFRDITIAGTAAGSSPTRAGDCGGNSGITFPAAKTVYWNLASVSNWSATSWCPTSGGTPDINQFPLAQDTAVFDNASSVTGTITINAAWNIGTFDASARTSSMTLTNSAACFVYGDWKFGTGLTSSSTSSIITFAKRGTQTITSSGIAFKCPIDVNSVNGLLQLADAFEIQGERNFTLTSGTFDAVTYNVTLGLRLLLTGSTTRTLKMGSGTWTLTVVDTFVVWDATTTTNLNFYKGTANILLSGAGVGSTRTFHGGGLSYNKLTIGGTTGTSTTTITGNNQFTELASTKTVAHTISFPSGRQIFGKWTVTGTAGNVVTLSGSGVQFILAGACTSGIDYLAMGSVSLFSFSPGEFYAGANSTGTAGAPVYRTAKPADSTRYWVGGTGNWSDTARWSTSSGGGSGASVPRSHDDVVFDSASNATAYTATVNAVTGGIRMKSLTIAGPASGNVTLAGSTAMDGIHGNVTLPATGLTRTYTGAMTLSSNSTGLTFTTNGVTLASSITLNGVDSSWSLGSALNIGSSSFQVLNGTFNFNTYNLTALNIAIDNGSGDGTDNSRTINLSTSTVTLSGSAPINLGTTETDRANLTITAGTSQIDCSATSPTFSGNNQTFYNVSFTSTSSGATVINGTNSFNNLSFSGLTSQGLNQITLTGNQTITGTLTFSAGTDATYRRFIRSDVIGTTRTLTVAAFSGTDVDFRDIAVTGAAAPISGTRLGDVKGNSGITFPSPKTVYVRSTGSAAWDSSTGWSATEGGTADITQFPLAQDTVIFPAATYPASGSTITISRAYNIGTIDMSLRTSNTVTLAMTSTFTNLVCGNLINGTGTTLSGTASLTFAGRGSQTITSAGKTFTQSFIINSPGGSVTLQDALTNSAASGNGLDLQSGTFDAATFNVTFSGNSAVALGNSTAQRTCAFGSGLWTIVGNTFSANPPTNLTVTGTGTISLTGASAKTFTGGDVSYTNITLNQGGNGALTISGNNTFKSITSTAAGANTINIGTSTQRITTSWTAAGTAGNILTVQGTSASSPGTLIFTGSGTAANVDYLAITGIRAYNLTDTWYAGANSTNNGSLGWYFQSGGTTITASVSETSTASDVISALGSFGSAVSETVNIADSILGGLLFQSDLSETVTGTDSVDAVLIFNRSVNESAIAVDSINTLATFNSNIAELTTGTDTVSSLGVLGADVSELSVASDQVAAGILFLSDIQESSNAADSVSVTLTLPADISETLTALDVVAAQAVFAPSISELVTVQDVTESLGVFISTAQDTATISDQINGSLLFLSNIAETAVVSDSNVGFITFPGVILETATTTDTTAAAATFEPSISETVTAQDVLTTLVLLNSSVSETVTAADSDVGFITFPTSINETSTASETFAAVALFTSTITESANSTDTTASLVTFGSLINEFVQTLDTFLVAASVFNAPFSDAAIASDSDVGFITFPTVIDESATAADEDVGFITFPASINETSTASEAVAAQAAFNATVSESSLALDAVAVAASVFNVVVPESAVAQDTINALAVFPASISETVTILDLTGGAFLWNMVDDSQGATWANVNNSQGAGWTDVNNSQGAAWQNVNNSQGAGWTDVNNSQGSPWTPVLP